MTLEQLSITLASLMLLVGIVLISRMRLSSFVSMFRVQAILLAGFALVHALSPIRGELIAVALLILVLKAIVIPRILMRVGKGAEGGERLQAYIRPTPATFIALLLVVAGSVAAYQIMPFSAEFLYLTVSFSLVFFGLMLLIVRRDMYGQGIGFLVMENGIYIFGLALAGGMPFFVEIGVLFDLMILFVLFIALLRRAHTEHASVGTDYLRELID